MLRRKGIRVVSITEHADDSPTGKLMEAIIESVDEFYSENLAEDVTRGMREAASRGFFLGSKAPFGYRRVKVSDGMKERPTLEVDPATAPVVKEIFESSLSGYGLKEICRTLNDRGITNRGKRWYKGGLHYLLTNEAYTGTAVWGRTTKVEKAQDPVRVEGAWPALVPRELFDAVQQAMRDRAPKVQRPGRVGSKFLLSGLLKCGVCGRPYSGQGAKSGLYVQAQSAHLVARVPVAPGSVRGLAPVTEKFQLTHGPIPAYLFELGLRWFQETPDTERFFAVRWDGDVYRVVVPEQTGTAASLTYQPPAGVVAEFHSHGKGRSFFSATDDKDEQGFRIYGVIGRLDTPEPELSLRVGVYGHFAPVEWPQVFGGPNSGVRLMGEEAVSTGSKDITTTRR